jgi:hypothetical protein
MPWYAYEVLLDLARPWKVPVWLVDGIGNYGDLRGGRPSEFRYTESRLSAAGEVVLAAERRELTPVPIGLINGSTYRKGRRPPFRPAGIIEAVRQVIRRPRVTGIQAGTGPCYWQRKAARSPDVVKAPVSSMTACTCWRTSSTTSSQGRATSSW